MLAVIRQHPPDAGRFDQINAMPDDCHVSTLRRHRGGRKYAGMPRASALATTRPPDYAAVVFRAQFQFWL